MMATYRVLTLANAPTQDLLNKALEGYLNGAATVRWNGDRWTCRFQSDASEPYRYLDPEFSLVRPYKERWFEVILDEDELNVLTRFQDEFVSAVAEGFVEFAKRYWKGTLAE